MAPFYIDIFEILCFSALMQFQMCILTQIIYQQLKIYNYFSLFRIIIQQQYNTHILLDLIEVHRNLNISDQQFDKFKTHLKSIAQDMEVSVEDIQELLEYVERHRNVIVFNK